MTIPWDGKKEMLHRGHLQIIKSFNGGVVYLCNKDIPYCMKDYFNQQAFNVLISSRLKASFILLNCFAICE